MNRRSLAALVALAAVGLTACGASAPPANELAIEVVDSMVARDEITQGEADCMIDKINAYEGDQLDEIADAADGGDPAAIEKMDQFQADLASCRDAG